MKFISLATFLMFLFYITRGPIATVLTGYTLGIIAFVLYVPLVWAVKAFYRWIMALDVDAGQYNR